MDFIINSSFIDMMIIFILFITIIAGYLKGFVYRGYDLAATVISLIVALYLSAPLSLMFKVYEVIGVGDKSFYRVFNFIWLFKVDLIFNWFISKTVIKEGYICF